MERGRRIFPLPGLRASPEGLDPRLANQARAALYALWAKRWEERAAAHLHRRALEECRLALLERRRRSLEAWTQPPPPGAGRDGSAAQLRVILEWERVQRMEALERRIRASRRRVERLAAAAQACLERARAMEETGRSILENP